jgi:hypothetical protein
VQQEQDDDEASWKFLEERSSESVDDPKESGSKVVSEILKRRPCRDFLFRKDRRALTF